MNPKSNIELHTGRLMPVLGLGTWQCTTDTAGTVRRALELGYRMIDTSGDYGTQPGIAEGLQRSGRERSAYYIVTKVEETEDAYDSTRKNVAQLRLEYADLMLIHRPPKSDAGEQLWEGLRRARDEGLAKDIGVSNYSIEQIEALIKSSGETPVVNQIEWSPFGYSEEMFEYCQDHNIVIQAYSPLTRGKKLEHDTLTRIAQKYGKSPAQVIIRWNLQMGTIPLPKANQGKHLEQNLDVFNFELDDDDTAALNALNEHFSSLGPKLKYEQ